MRVNGGVLRVFGPAIVVALGLAELLYAQSGSQVINACYQKEHGQLRIIGNGQSCLPSENAISWNQVGPMGPAGPQGPAGPAGPTGPRGPSDAYDGYRNPYSTYPITGGTSNPTTILSFQLPAGSFAITSKVNISAPANGNGLVHCVTQTTSGWYDMGVASIGPGPGQTLQASMSTNFTAQNGGSPAQLTITCERINWGGTDAPIAWLPEAVATQIANAHTIYIP